MNFDYERWDWWNTPPDRLVQEVPPFFDLPPHLVNEHTFEPPAPLTDKESFQTQIKQYINNLEL